MTFVVPPIRAKKTNKNQDDLRVMVAGVIFLIVLICLKPVVFSVYESFSHEKTEIHTTVGANQ